MAQSIQDTLSLGPATSKELQRATGLSQAAVSRKLKMMGNTIIKQKRGRTVRYSMTKNAFGGNDNLPLYCVDAYGNNTAVANIRPLIHGGFFVQAHTGMPSVLLGLNGDGIYEDLPYFLYDLSPQGFLGRQIAEEMASRSEDFPEDPRMWDADHIGRYLISNGDDLPGNFKFGEQAHLRFRRKPIGVTADDYPQLAEDVMSGILPGSSAGGEQPKFTAFCRDRSCHVIVKFSPKEDNEISRRWRDILITEHHASEALHEANWPAAETRLLERGGRLFLESERFDRSGEYGRMSMISLFHVDNEFTGKASGWDRVMTALYKENLVSYQHFYDATCLWNFGLLINNTDMHLGNLSLSIDGGVFRILPAYDMCSMGFAPKASEVLPFSFTPTEIEGNLLMNEATSDHIKRIAENFWLRVYNDDRISREFYNFLSLDNPMNNILPKSTNT